MRSVDKGLVVDVEKEGVAGRLLIQPKVVSKDGETLLLDECLGSNFSIIGYDCDPSVVLVDQVLAQWTGFGASVVAISSTMDHSLSDAIVDESGELGEWIAAKGPSVLLVRPDKFCMMSAAPKEADEKLNVAHTLLCP